MNQSLDTERSEQSRVPNPTLNSLSPSAVAAVRRIPAHEQSVIPCNVARRPASIYTDVAYFEREQQAIFKRFAVPVGVSAQLPEPNMFQAVKAYGLPLLLSRDAKGEAKVFLNACQHRGSIVVERTDAFKAGRVSCPYHAWTYSTTGALVGVPRQEVFEGLKKEELGLAELPSKEAGGLIWAMLDRHARPDFSTVSEELMGDFDALNISQLHLYGHKTFELNANWKLVIEPFLESYHIQRLHAQSVASMFADLLGVVDVLGDHVRQLSGKAQFDPSLLDIPGENIHKHVTFAYLVFPSTVVITSPYYVGIQIVKPNGVNKSTVEYFMLTRDKPDNDKARDLFSRSFEMILHVFGNEDYRAACMSQTGLESGALKEVVFGGMESRIPLFYKNVEKHLERYEAARTQS